MENRKDKLNKADKRGKILIVFIITGWAVLATGWLICHKHPNIIPIVAVSTGAYFVVATVLAVRAIRNVK